MAIKRRDVLKGAAVAGAAGAGVLITTRPSHAQKMDAAKRWVDSEFQPSTLSLALHVRGVGRRRAAGG